MNFYTGNGVENIQITINTHTCRTASFIYGAFRKTKNNQTKRAKIKEGVTSISKLYISKIQT